MLQAVVNVVETNSDRPSNKKKMVAVTSRKTTSVNENPTFTVRLSPRFVASCLAVSAVFAFCVGQMCRHILLRQIGMNVYGGGASAEWQRQQQQQELLETNGPGQRHQGSSLPQPVLSAGKRMPNTMYTSKQYNTGIPSSSDSVLLAKPPSLGGGPRSVHSEDFAPVGGVQAEDGYHEDDEEHAPAGQHLLIDIENVDGAFLNSEERLARAMIEMVDFSGLTMLSYHCHALEPIGVSCVAVLLESHVSFHTWPVPGVITLDVFTCGSRPLRPLVKHIERLFGIPKQTVAGDDEPVEPPRMKWMQKNRGFERSVNSTNPESVDIRQFMTGWMEYDLKEEVASVETDYQTIDVFDVINPRFRSLESYKKSLSGDGSYEAQHPELFRPDRVVYLDGIMQSRRYGDAAYHESLVHPAMFAHDKPERVAIIGGGEGATLREVLKHTTVKKATMVEIDGIMVSTSKTYLPEWSDCSDLVGSAPSCFDDKRTELLVTDAISWFINHFGKGVSIRDEDRYDVIIMDAL